MSLKRKALSDGKSAYRTDASVFLLDIEGTTTSINFVKDELFPYITENVESYLESHFDDEETEEDLKLLRSQVVEDCKANVEGVVEIASTDSDKTEIIHTAVANVKWQMSLDRKTTALKQLQGHMWKDAYAQGKVKGHVYKDVKGCLEKWKEANKTICIYSSGSVAAQKLLFKNSEAGDLTTFLTDYFDTKIGSKREANSYTNIAAELKVEPKQILFLTDILEEAKAADEAGMGVGVVQRGRSADAPEVTSCEDYPTIENFEEIVFTDETGVVEEEGETPAKVAKQSVDAAS